MEAIHDFDPKTRSIIGRTASALKTLDAFARMDREDIEQEVATRLCARLKNYDQARYVFHKFVNVAMGSIKTDMIRAMNADNEIGRRSKTTSLNRVRAVGDEGESLTAADIIPDGSAPLADEVAFAIDLEELLASLSDELRLAARLLTIHTQEEVAAEMNMPLSTFRRCVLVPLREALAPFRDNSASA